MGLRLTDTSHESAEATMPSQQRRVVLPNGLCATLVHMPDAPRAAALLRVGAGSHDEPEGYPGLAHFLEHLVFLGGAGYRDSERLMPWVQGRGGRLNASTRARTTDYFFEMPFDALGEGLARLVDMLAEPILAVPAQLAEREVLEAEFVARSTDPDTLIDAALTLGLPHGHPSRRFVAGRRASLVVEEEAFQNALHGFHQRLYRAANMCLWLQGPQPLDELEALAEREAGSLPQGAGVQSAASESLLPLAGEDLQLRLPGVPRLVLAFALDGVVGEGGPLLERLGGWLADEAHGSLLAHLGQAGLCDSARLRLSNFAAGQALLRFDFELAETSAAEAVEAAFLGWLAALRKLPPEGLAAAPIDEPGGVLEQLQRRVRTTNESAWLDQLQESRLIRLLAAESVRGESLTSAGFALDVARSPRHPANPLHSAEWTFTPARSAGSSVPGALHLRWRFAQTPERQAFLVARQALRPLAGLARRESATLDLEGIDGDWALLLSGPKDRLAALAASAIETLRNPPATVVEQGARLLCGECLRRAGEMPIRQLLDLLPQVLVGESEAPSDWLTARWDALAMDAELPANIPGRPTATALPPRTGQAGRHIKVLEIPGEAALLLFCPLASRAAADEATWRLLARVLEPAFHHWLRGERQLAYALYCGFRQIGGRRGILFAVQSPLLSAVELQAEVDCFLQRQGEALRLLDPQRIDGLREPLAAEMAKAPGDFAGRVQQAWDDRLAGVAANHRAAMASALNTLTASELCAAHSALMSAQGGHWLLLGRA